MKVYRDDSEFWRQHCWSKRFGNSAIVCAMPAKWRGPPNSDSAFVRAWRACGEDDSIDRRLRRGQETRRFVTSAPSCYSAAVNRAEMMAECPCGETFWTIDEYRRLPLDSVVRVDDRVRWELRHCKCDQLLRVRIDRDGAPVPMLA